MLYKGALVKLLPYTRAHEASVDGLCFRIMLGCMNRYLEDECPYLYCEVNLLESKRLLCI